MRALAVLLISLAGLAPNAGADSPVPGPNEAIPRSPGPLAARLAEVSGALRDSIDRWRAAGISRGPAPPEVQLGALYQQRAARLLARRPGLGRRVLRRLPRQYAGTMRDSVAAVRDLFRLAGPPQRRHYRTGAALPAGALLRHYRAAQRRFGVSWRVLAAVNLVETDFNRLRNNSTSGAQGPMQFLPATWRVYGLGGDLHDPHDAILGAAHYLRRSGAPGSYGRALYAYNPSPLYVDAALRLARRMRGDGFLALYNWQVFVRTPAGERRLTGPGR